MSGLPAGRRALAEPPRLRPITLAESMRKQPQASLAQVNPTSLKGIASYFEEMS
jgi:hypothetical protein